MSIFGILQWKKNWERFGWFWHRKFTLALFDTSPLHQFSKFNNFLWVCWFLDKNIFNFVPVNLTTRITILSRPNVILHVIHELQQNKHSWWYKIAKYMKVFFNLEKKSSLMNLTIIFLPFKIWHFWLPVLPTSSCKLSLWTTPYVAVDGWAVFGWSEMHNSHIKHSRIILRPLTWNLREEEGKKRPQLLKLFQLFQLFKLFQMDRNLKKQIETCNTFKIICLKDATICNILSTPADRICTVNILQMHHLVNTGQYLLMQKEGIFLNFGEY